MNKGFKLIIFYSSLIIILFLLLEAWRENLNMDWQKYQRKYKDELTHIAQNEQERQMAQEYEIKLRQTVLPRLNRFDRCVTCHVGIEDQRMSHMEHPLKSHPGDYLETHDVNEVGCTSCHDGQGRAITVAEAHGRGMDKFWEKPLLPKPFQEATCVRCHANTLSQAPTYNAGQILFKQKGCFACHRIDDIGGKKGPALSDIGNASFHVKMPIDENREKLMHKYHENVNLAYLYESIADPAAQPTDSEMQKQDFTEEEITAIMVYLKSLSSERRAMDIGVKKQTGAEPMQTAAATVAAISSSKAKVSGESSKGYLLFTEKCAACHTMGGGDTVGPDLQGVTDRREEGWLKRLIQFPAQMIEEKDPIVMELLAKYKTPMVNMGLTGDQVDEIIKYLKNPEAISIEEVSKDAESSVDEVQAKKAAVDIDKGRRLFQGKQRFLNGGASCISCHDVRDSTIFGGGTLAKELTTSYSRLRDAGTKAVLKKPPFPVMKEAYEKKPLTSDEIDALTIYLEHVDKEQGNEPSVDYRSKMIGGGVIGLIVVLVFYGVFWFNRRKKLVNKGIYDRQKKSEKGM